MDEEIVPVCSPRLIEKYFPDAVMINENTYDLSPEDLLKSLSYNKPLDLAFGKNGFSLITCSTLSLLMDSAMNYFQCLPLLRVMTWEWP